MSYFVSSTARKLPVKYRTDLTVERQLYHGRIYWLLRDPIGGRFFRLEDGEYALLQLFDGNHSLNDIKLAFEKNFSPQQVQLNELQHLLGQFHQNGLIIASAPNQGEELLKRNKKRKRKELLQKFTNVLAIKFKGFDPDRMLNFLYPLVRMVFHPFFLFAALCLCLAALTLILVQFDTFQSKLPEFYTFFSPVNLLCLSAVLAATKILHEFGHGLTAKHFRCECHEMGVMILVLTPCLYVNISDAWLLPNKWHRIAIAAAGMASECTLAAFCTFIWWFSVPGLLHYLALNIMFVSSVSTILFNINPLLRYDGYYMLSDYLEIPNLRQKASKILTRQCSQILLGIKPQKDPFLPKQNQIWFALYSIGAFFYRWVITASILFFLYAFFKQYDLKILGHAVAVMSLFSLLVMPMIKVVKFFWIPGRIYQVKLIRFYFSVTILTAVISFILFYPLPHTVIAPAMTELRQTDTRQVFVPDIKGGCMLREICVVPGQFVEPLQILAVLENPSLQMELTELEGKCGDLQQELKALEAMQNYKPETALRIGPVKQSLAASLELLANKRQDAASLVLRSPVSGIIVSPPRKPHKPVTDDQLPEWFGTPLEPENLGATLEAGTLVCCIGDPKRLEAALIVDQSKTVFLYQKQRSELKLHEFPDKTYFGKIEEIEKQPVTSLPMQLSTRAGGEIPTSSQPDGSELPNRAHYRVRMLLDNDDLSIRAGMTGIAKIHTDNQTLGYRLWTLFNETFNFRL
ncbi:MAG: hypothetical protein LBH00_03805 [Planctomycetaceae bacterium]|jgi:putative peptide zinc metalloprotease protein|nr:hypothetical protein [Planctomycetaceae bacterium]